MTAQQGEELKKNQFAFTLHILLMTIWVLMEFLSAHYLYEIFNAKSQNQADNIAFVTVTLMQDLSIAADLWLILCVIELY